MLVKEAKVRKKKIGKKKRDFQGKRMGTEKNFQQLASSRSRRNDVAERAPYANSMTHSYFPNPRTHTAKNTSKGYCSRLSGRRTTKAKEKRKTRRQRK